MLKTTLKSTLLKQTTLNLARASFSAGTTSASDSESEASYMRPKIDPSRKQVTDFLKNTSLFEDQQKDTLQPYFFKSERLQGSATE